MTEDERLLAELEATFAELEAGDAPRAGTTEQPSNSSSSYEGNKSPNILFPGILPDPLEPNDQVLALGLVDLHRLRSGLHLMMLQLQVALASIEQLEYTQRTVQEALRKKEGN